MLPRHPSTIANLAPDCRRVLVSEYARVQVASDPERLVPDAECAMPRRRTTAEIRRDTAAAIAEYRRVAEMWGVTV